MQTVIQPAWTSEDALELYHVPGWSDRYFDVDAQGRVIADVNRDGSSRIVLDDVVRRMRAEGVPFPLLIRLQDIVKSRVQQLNEAFSDAIRDAGFTNCYRGVYPIKVNQLHEVVDEILDAGLPYGMGLECGSKAELVACMPFLEKDDTLLICNGYKDAEMLDLVLTGQQIGKEIIPVVEKLDEFERLLDQAAARNIRPRFGLRIRLKTAGAGKWADSGGDLSKFGVSISELVTVLTRLSEEDLSDSLVLIHFHLGSQISDIQTLRAGVKEITRTYAQLIARGIPVRYLDVGGGLGVNYEAGLSDSDEGINYSLQEYANAVVGTVCEICDAEGAPHPVLVSESGRALAAHHSVLVVDVLGAYRKDEAPDNFVPEAGDHAVVRQLFDTLEWIRSTETLRPGELLEAYHDAVSKRQEADSLYGFGYLPLEQKGRAEQLYWSVCRLLNSRVRDLSTDWLPADLEALDEHLVDQYLCDFSVFQSILDHWAFGQRFPVMPLTRLDEEPDRRAVLVDLTCDSDGKVKRYVTSNDDTRFINVHALTPGEPYSLGFFMMGAYQDIMGDMHNLFGRVSEVHIFSDDEEPDGYYVEKVIRGTSVQEILALVQYFPQDLRKRMEAILLAKVRSGGLRRVEAVRLLDRFSAMFDSSTYLHA